MRTWELPLLHRSCKSSTVESPWNSNQPDIHATNSRRAPDKLGVAQITDEVNAGSDRKTSKPIVHHHLMLMDSHVTADTSHHRQLGDLQNHGARPRSSGRIWPCLMKRCCNHAQPFAETIFPDCSSPPQQDNTPRHTAGTDQEWFKITTASLRCWPGLHIPPIFIQPRIWGMIHAAPASQPTAGKWPAGSVRYPSRLQGSGGVHGSMGHGNTGSNRRNPGRRSSF